MSKIKRFLCITVTTAFLLTALFGCGTQGNNSDKTASDESKEVTEKILKDGLKSDPQTMNPLYAVTSESLKAVNLVYASLLQYDEKRNLLPYIAEELPTISEDKKTITFKIRKDIKWTDGQPLTSADIKFSYEVVIDPKVASSYMGYFTGIEKIETPDDYTVVFTLKKPDSGLMEFFNLSLIIPKHIWEKEDRANFQKSKYSNEPVGCGPFKLAEWKKGERVVFEKNKDFFYSKVKLDKWICDISGKTSIIKLEKGEINYTKVENMEDVIRFKQISGIKIVDFQIVNFDFIMYNNKGKFFSDKKVRQAMTYGIDKEAYAQGIYKGMVTPTDTSYPEIHRMYDPNVKKYGYDPEMAKKLLDEAGWKLGADGVRAKNGVKFQVTAYAFSGNPVIEKAIVFLQSQLKPLGVSIEVKLLDKNTLLSNYIATGKFDMLLLSVDYGLDNQAILWHSDPNIGSINWGGYSNPVLDQLWDKATATYDLNEQKAIYSQVQQILSEDQPATILINKKSFYAMKENVIPQLFNEVSEIRPYDVDIK